MTLEGFVTIGRGELLLSMLAVALLMCVLGYAIGQIVMMARRPEPIKLRPITPEDEERGRKMLREMCPGPHCDDNKQMASWLADKDFRLITNEMLTEMRADLVRHRNRPVNFHTADRPAFDLDPSLIETLKAVMAKANSADGPEITKWPGGDPDDV